MNITTNTWPATTSTAKALSIDGIETINLTALDTINVDLSLLKNNKYFNVKDSTAPVTLTNIPNATIVLGLGGSQVNKLTAQFTKALVKTADSLEVTLDKANNADFTLKTDPADKPFGFAELNVQNVSTLTKFEANVPTLTISGTGALTVGDTTTSKGLVGVTDIELTNTGAIKLGKIGTTALPPATSIDNGYLTTFKAPTNTGGITTGLIQGSTGGFTMQLGSGADSISVQDNTTLSTNINDMRLGAGNDSLTFTKGTSGNTYISGEDNDDKINIIGTGSLTSIDTIDGGNGNDTIIVGVGGTFFINGGAGADVINDGAGSNVIDGGADSDTITGGVGNDTITGGAGSDTIYVDSGNDTITDFTIGSDKLIISSGAKAYVYALGIADYSKDVTNSGTLDIDRSRTYEGKPVTADETITGSSGTDLIKGGAGNDNITGGLGNDAITAGAGIDTITDFKIGEDTLSIIAGATAHVYVSTAVTGTTLANYNTVNSVSNLGTLYIDGTTTSTGLTVTGAENITGSAGADSIIGGSGNDTITLGLGNDTITAALGNDIITDFSPISDKLIISNGASATIYTSGTADFSTSVTNSDTGTLIIDGSRNHLGVMVTNAENTTGSTGADVIYGGSGNDTITGGLGNDTIDGKEGSDNIIVNSGTDTINNYLPSTDTLIISSGAIAHVYTSNSNSYAAVTNNGTLYIDGIDAGGTQSITGSNGADSIVGGGYNDTITGGDGNDTISGGYGDDSITGGLGNDTISGGSGRNTITVDSGTDTITDFLLSYDTLIVNSGAIAHLNAFTNNSSATADYSKSNITNSGKLYIDGSKTYDGTLITVATEIKGSSGADIIVGGSGNDTIFGFSGNDTITGGAGNDIITVGNLKTDTIITDFNPILDKLTITGPVSYENKLVYPIAHVYVYASGTENGDIRAVQNRGYLYIDGSTTTNAKNITGSNFLVEPIPSSGGKDSIVGGSGNDTITGGTGIDTLTGGAGADTFVFGINDSPYTAPDSITDFTSGTDLIRFAGAVVFNKVTPVTGVGVTVNDYGFATFYDQINPIDSYSKKVSALQASTTNAAQTVTLFVDGSDTYVFFAGATTSTTDDQVIKLTGVSGRFFDEITKVNDTDIVIS